MQVDGGPNSTISNASSYKPGFRMPLRYDVFQVFWKGMSCMYIYRGIQPVLVPLGFKTF